MNELRNDPLIFERSRPGRRGYTFPGLDVPRRDPAELVGAGSLRTRPAALPEVSEVDLVRHYTHLSRKNFGVDLGFYPLGSCTMKYNPKVNEDVASLAGFRDPHPLLPDASVQGMLEMMHRLIGLLCEITGMSWGTLQPFAGAHGEFVGMKLFRSYFRSRGETGRTRILVPDSAHGTNPASAHISGFDVVEIRSSRDGMVSIESLEEHLDDSVAGIMLTNPNTLGLFERDIEKIARMVHEAGGLLYYDGANLNAIMGKVRPGDMGFDVVHLNLHKTFSTPHGGGGPGSGPVLAADRLVPFLPVPDVEKSGDRYRFTWDRPHTMGRVAGFHGNIGVAVRALAYILTMGGEGLKQVSEQAVVNANYLKERLKEIYHLPFDRLCKHEFVLSARNLKEEKQVTALQIAKRLIDFGIHPPTVYFPLIVPEALMIEPTETEPKESLDGFIEAMERIREEADRGAPELRDAPSATPIRKVDEVLAAKKPVIRWRPQNEQDDTGTRS